MGRLKVGIMTGFVTGYVMGAKAGHRRYEQIRTAWWRIKSSPLLRRASETAGTAIGAGLERGRFAAVETLDRVKDRVKERRAAP
ncbi:MAG: YtxH domain-containing protein [Actinomycetota bacterium]